MKTHRTSLGRLIASSAAVFALALTAAAQEPARPFQEQIDVSAVLIDAIVTDRTGQQILGLSKDDFVVRENGVAQPIDSADYYTNLRLLNAREESAPFKVERVHEGRYFVFFFDKPDDPGVLFDRISNARAAVRKFVDKEMAQGDRVAIVGHDRRLKVYSDFTSDKAQLKRALDAVASFGPGVTTAGSESPSIVRNLASGQMMNTTGTVYEALEAMGDALKPIRGRKNLVLFSAGVRDLDEMMAGDLLVTRSRHFDPMIRSLNTANVSVYAVQLQRDTVGVPVVHQRLEEISSLTSGEYSRFNVSFEPTLRRIDNRNNGYYLITYQARHPKGESGFQKVEVTVRNPEFRVAARPGYAYGE